MITKKINERLELRDGILYENGDVSKWQPTDISTLDSEALEKYRKDVQEALESVRRLKKIFMIGDDA